MKFEPPKRMTEANLQAWFFSRCMMEKIPCYLEYKPKRVAGERGSRFDAVIHQYEEIIFIIEIKNVGKRTASIRKRYGKKYAQVERYEAFGVPVLVIHNYAEVEPILAQIKEAIMHSDWRAA